LNPSSYTINKRAGDGTFVINRNSTETATTPLAPFADATGTKYWTSESARQTATFNYAYPETQRWKFSSDADYQNSVRSAVQQLYGGISNQFMAMSTPAIIPSTENVEAASAPPAEQHPFRDLVGNIKEGILGHSNGGDGTRGIDLESEIGKCKSLT
jgi:tyrosinase